MLRQKFRTMGGLLAGRSFVNILEMKEDDKKKTEMGKLYEGANMSKDITEGKHLLRWAKGC